jgi:hypothetical protein
MVNGWQVWWRWWRVADELLQDADVEDVVDAGLWRKR